MWNRSVMVSEGSQLTTDSESESPIAPVQYSGCMTTDAVSGEPIQVRENQQQAKNPPAPPVAQDTAAAPPPARD